MLFLNCLFSPNDIFIPVIFCLEEDGSGLNDKVFKWMTTLL